MFLSTTNFINQNFQDAGMTDEKMGIDEIVEVLEEEVGAEENDAKV